MTISNILNAESLLDLLDATEEFCQNAIMRDNDDECISTITKEYNLKQNCSDAASEPY